MRSFVVALTGRDRPGIVAEVTAVLLEHGLNIEDAEMAILRGHFTVMLVVAGPEEVDETALRDSLARLAAAVPLESVTLTEVARLEAVTTDATHTISVYGADHPGIVHGVASVLAEQGVNVVGLSTRVAGRLYVMLLEVALPASLAGESLAERLATVGAEQGVDVSVRATAGDAL